MKKVVIIVLFVILFAYLYYCYNNPNLTPREKEEKSIASCQQFISNSEFTNKDSIDFSITMFEMIPPSLVENAKKYSKSPSLIDETDWIVTIGDTSNFDYCRLIVDSKTLRCVGYFPID